LRGSSQSNYPVSGKLLEPVRGVLRTQDWFKQRDLQAVMRPVVSAKPSDNLVTALELLRPASTRLLVVMEGVNVIGLVTLNDILQHLIGPIGTD